MSIRPTAVLGIQAASSMAVATGAINTLEFSASATLYAVMAHPSQNRIYAVVAAGIDVFSVSAIGSLVRVGAVAAAVGLIGNKALQGIAFDSTGRYMYVTSGVTSLYTFDFGAAFVNLDAPTLVNTDVITTGGASALHVLTVVGATLYILADTTTNAFHVVSLATPSNPSVTTTTDIATAAAVSTGAYNANNPAGATISYPGATNGAIRTVLLATPTTQALLTLPTYSTLQLIADSIYFASTKYMNVLVKYSNGGTPARWNCYWMVFDVTDYGSTVLSGSSTSGTVCTTETLIYSAAGVTSVAQINAPAISVAPKLASGIGNVYTGITNEYDFAVAVQSEDAGAKCQIRFYRANWSSTTSHAPKLVMALDMTNTYSQRVGPISSLSGYWFGAGTSGDKVNAILNTFTATFKSYQDQSSFTTWTGYVCTEPGFKVSIGIDGEKPTDRIASTGTLTFELDNSQFNLTGTLSKFSPDGTASIALGDQVRLGMDIGGATTYVFRGLITSIEVVPGKYAARRVKVTCEDMLKTLAETKTDTLPVQTGIAADQIIQSLFDYVPLLPGTETSDSIFVGASSIPSTTYGYAFDRAYDEKTAIIGEIQKLINSTRGVFFFDPTSNTPAVRLKDDLRNESVLRVFDNNSMYGMQFSHAKENVFSNISARVYPRLEDAANVTLFTLNDKPLIKPAETLVVIAAFRNASQLNARIGGKSLVLPVVTTDYTFFTKKTSGGTNITTSLSVSTNFGGTGAKVSIYNNNALGGYLRTLKIRGIGIYTQEPVVYTDAITGAILMEPLLYEMPYETDPLKGKAMVTTLLGLYGTGKTFVRNISIHANESDTLYEFLTYLVGDKIALRETVSGLSSTNEWILGTGKLTTNTYLFPYRTYQIQKINFTLSDKNILDVTYGLLPSEEQADDSKEWTNPRTWVTGEYVHKDQFQTQISANTRALRHQKVIQTANVAVATSTVLVNLTGLKFAMKAGETWVFQIYSDIGSNVTANVKYSIASLNANDVAADSIVTGRWGGMSYAVPITAAILTSYVGAPAVADTARLTISDTALTCCLLSGKATALVDSTLQVMGAQSTSSGTTTFYANSFLIAHRVGG